MDLDFDIWDVPIYRTVADEAEVIRRMARDVDTVGMASAIIYRDAGGKILGMRHVPTKRG